MTFSELKIVDILKYVDLPKQACVGSKSNPDGCISQKAPPIICSFVCLVLLVLLPTLAPCGHLSPSSIFLSHLLL